MKQHLRFIIYGILVILLIVLFSGLLETEQGQLVSELEFVTYDNVLYSPEELHNLTEEEKAAGHVGWDYDYNSKEFSNVRTNQLILHLTFGQVYGLYTEQLTYAANLWIDGVQMVESGVVSDSPEGFVPHTGSVVVYFTAGEKTEIVMQRCNFNHAKWNAVQIYIGPQDVITHQVQNKYFRVTLMLGFLATLGLINLGMFAGMIERKGCLWFSLACFSMMIHESLTDPKLIMLVFPDLNWYVSYKTEEWSLFLILIFTMLFLQESFKKLVPRWIVIPLLCIVLAMGISIMVIPTLVYTRFSLEAEGILAVCTIIYCGVLMIRAFSKWKKLQLSQRYYLIGILVFIACGALNLLRYGPRHTYQIELGLILFASIATVALAMEYRDVKHAYELSKHKEEQLRRMNEAMEQSKEIQENFIEIMNHEMRTPLTVIAGYADLSAKQLQEQEPVDEDMIRNLQLVKSEALRLGRIVKQTEQGSRTVVTDAKAEKENVWKLLEDAKDFSKPICEKRQNAIEVQCDENLYVLCMRDYILQALYNLIINACRHTKNGLILLCGKDAEEEVVLQVVDDGDGMDEETISMAFERGFSKDGGHGLGLALCKEITERHSGRIWIEQNETRGITVNISLPKTGIH